MRRSPLLALALGAMACIALPGCLARSALDVATAPVRAAGAAVDLATTSRSEADEMRGRALRRRDERLGQLHRDHIRHSRQCQDGNPDSCARADADRAEIDAILDESY